MEQFPERIFLGNHRPTLPLAVDWVFSRFLDAGRLDLRNCLIVLPSSLACRRLLELLVAETKKKSLSFFPPEIITVGVLPEKLYQPKRTFASDLEQSLAWSNVLRQQDRATLEASLFQPPEANGIEEWLDLANLVSRMHRELASDNLDFASVAKVVSIDVERERWLLLSKLQKDYLHLLDQLELWDIQTARRVALQKNEPTTDRQILVIGAVDLNRVQKGFLKSVASQVSILVTAAAHDASLFDRFGCVITEQWIGRTIDLTEEQIEVASGPEAQAVRFRQVLTRLLDDHELDQVAVIAPDDSLIPYFSQQLRRLGLNAYHSAGIALGRMLPCTLLAAVAEYLESDSYSAFGTLIRHPVVDHWLTRTLPEDAARVSQVDLYHRSTLLRSIRTPSLPDHSSRSTFEKILGALDRWLAAMRRPPMTLREWILPALSFLKEAFDFSPQLLSTAQYDELSKACEVLNQILASVRETLPTLDHEFSGPEAIRLLLQLSSGESITRYRNSNDVEMIGWLDLSFVDSPAVILTGLTEDFVPGSSNADAFLPNRLRAELGLIDNDRRLARDLYAFDLLLKSHRSVTVVSGRTDADGAPKLPSRLLLATPEEQIGKRVSHLFPESEADHESTEPPFVAASDPPLERSRFDIPWLDGSRQKEFLSVTDFQAYMACPYRFYLNRILRLDAIDDSWQELNSADFGTLLHACFEHLSQPEMKSETNPKRLESFLIDKLEVLTAERFGSHLPPALLIQKLQCAQRLKKLAEIQAERARAGWIIYCTEISIDRKRPLLLPVDESPAKIIGRIDRVDFHPDENLWAVWDYKTSDRAKDPLNVHYNRSTQTWHDLQLPLYHLMVQHFDKQIQGNIQLGYITLPRKLSDTEFRTADFSPELIEEGIGEAKEIVRKLRERTFGPPVFPPPHSNDLYAAICQNDIARRGRWSPPSSPSAT